MKLSPCVLKFCILGMNAGEPICITSQYSALLNAMADCDSCDIDLDDFKDFIRDTLGYFPDEAPNLSSVKKSAFASLTNSVDIDLLDSVFQQFPCNECTGRLCEYKDKMMKSKYSEHKIPPLEEGMKCITSVFKDVADSSNPLCEDIVAKKSFCAAFDIKPAALRLVDCCELDDTTIILKWQLPQLPCIVDMFQKELSDSSLEILAPLKLRSLKVDSITLYFYQIKDITEPTQLVSIYILYTIPYDIKFWKEKILANYQLFAKIFLSKKIVFENNTQHKRLQKNSIVV